MTAPHRLALARATLIVAALTCCAPLLAQNIVDGPPFSADPKALLAAAQKVDAKDLNVAYLLDEATFSFEADGRSKSEWHEIQYIVTPDGVEGAGTVSAWWAPWYDDKPTITARVVAKDGTVHTLDPKAITEATADEEPDMFSDQRVLRAPLPGVAEGSIVETVITIEGRSPIAGGGKSGMFQFASSTPLEHSRLTLDAAASVTPRIVNKSGLEPHTTEHDGRKRIVFEKGHSDAVEDEETHLPSDESTLPYVAFSTGTSWHEIASNYSAIVDKQIAMDGDLKEVVAKAVGTATDHAIVMARLLDVIEKNVRYAGVEVGDGSFVPRPPKSVLQKKYGDCKDKATLLAAMLRTAGIPAHVALLDAGPGLDTISGLPGVDHFDHAIVIVDGPPSVWIDPTDEFGRPGELPIQDQGRMALIAGDATIELTRTPEAASAANRYVEARTFKLPEEGDAHVTETTEGTWIEDATLRHAYAASGKKEYRESLEKYATGYYVAPKLDSYEAGDPHDFTKPFRLTLQMSKSKSGIVVDGAADVLIPMEDIVSFLPSALRDYQEKTAEAKAAKPEKKRVHDFVFPRPMTKEWDYLIVPAPGFAARTLPQSDSTKLGSVTLATDYTTDAEGAIHAKIVLDSGKRRLTPAEFEETRVAVSKLAVREGVHLGFESVGQTKLNAGDIGAALTEFRKLAALHPKEAQHHIELARALLAGGIGDAARDEARRAVAIEPSNAKAHSMLATTLEHDLLGRPLRSGCDLPGAIAALRKAKELDPTNAHVRARLAELLTYGDRSLKFGRNAHLAESIDEYKSLLKDLGKEGAGYQPPLMLVLCHAGRWDEVKELVKTETDVRQRNLFHITAVVATEGSAAGLRELGAFDAEKRRGYGLAVGATMVTLRRYSEAADLYEEAIKGSAKASQMLALVQILRKTQPYEKTLDDSPKSLVVKLVETALRNDEKVFKTLIVPELAGHDDFVKRQTGFSLRSATGSVDLDPTTVVDLFIAGVQVQEDGSDEIGYRLRLRSSAGTAPPGTNSAFYVQRRDGKVLLAAIGESPETIGATALRLANDGKLEAARTWLNWARESIAAGGGDDPLSGPPFARLWQKEKPSASAGEIRLAAAALTAGSEFGEESASVLATLRDQAATEDAKNAIDVALVRAYAHMHEWNKVIPIVERLSKAHPDSGSAFTTWANALMATDKMEEAVAITKERLERMPKDAAGMRQMALIFSKKGDYDSAVTWSRRLVDDIEPTNHDYNEAAWIALFRGKELDRAIDDARRATADENSADGNMLHTLAALYAESGKSVEARQALLKSIDARNREDPQSADWYVLGRIAENYGVRDAAVSAYKRVEKGEVDGLSTWELVQKRMAVMGVK